MFRIGLLNAPNRTLLPRIFFSSPQPKVNTYKCLKIRKKFFMVLLSKNDLNSFFDSGIIIHYPPDSIPAKIPLDRVSCPGFFFWAWVSCPGFFFWAWVSCPGFFFPAWQTHFSTEYFRAVPRKFFFLPAWQTHAQNFFFSPQPKVNT
jgi:hypothetical protein